MMPADITPPAYYAADIAVAAAMIHIIERLR